MRNLIIFIIIVGAGIFFYKKYFDKPEAMGEITQPVYAEAHMTIEGKDRRGSGSRSIEAVTYMAAADEEDCQKQLEELKHSFDNRFCPGGTCELQKSECKSELLPRYKRLFDNQPTSLTYISFARGGPEEREARLIFWGISVEESESLCAMVPAIQKKFKGKVSCVHALKE